MKKNKNGKEKRDNGEVLQNYRQLILHSKGKRLDEKTDD